MNNSPVLDELIELLGQDDAMRLCLRHGSERIYFSARTPPWLDLPDDKLAVMQQHFLGDTLVVPLAKRNVALWLIEDQGLSIAQVASRLRIAQTTVWRYLDPAPEDHPSLFRDI